MEYITETRGGWDEWSDEYSQVLGLRLDTGETIETRFISDRFVDTNGNKVEIELPGRKRIGDEITVERYEPEYSVSSLTLNQLEDYMNQKQGVIAFEQLAEKHEFDPV